MKLTWICNKAQKKSFYPANEIPLFGKPKSWWIRDDQQYWECRSATMLEF